MKKLSNIEAELEKSVYLVFGRSNETGNRNISSLCFSNVLISLIKMKFYIKRWVIPYF